MWWVITLFSVECYHYGSGFGINKYLCKSLKSIHTFYYIYRRNSWKTHCSIAHSADSEGKIVIAQMPNLPLSVGIVASLLTLIVTTGKINLGLELVAFGSLFTWAWQELFQGVNYFRRALGLIGLVGLIAWKLQ
jgi:hypothetical protein